MRRCPPCAPPSLSRRTVLQRATLAATVLGIGGHLRHAAAQDATLEAAILTEPNISYGEVDGQELLLDIYRPSDGDAAAPAVLLFHPGGMTDGDRTWMDDAARGLATAGYVAFTIGYRLFGGGTRNSWPTQLDDAQRAVRWVRTNAETYGVNPERLAAYGHSSGAQLAAFLGTRDTRDDTDPTLAGVSSRVACVVDLAGTMDLTIPLSDPGLQASWDALLGGTPDQASYRDFSPIAFVDEQTPPFLILQGGMDAPSQIANSRRMEEVLRETGVEVVYGEFPSYDHFVWDWAHAGPWALPFLDQHLRPEA